MPSTRNRRARTAALLAAVVTASMISGGSARAVSGVSPVPAGSYLFTAKIQNDLRACSAALVEPTWVITTASCLAEPGKPVVAGPPSRPTTVTVGRSDLSAGGGHVLAVTAVLPHPSRNVVLAQLEQEATGVAPVTLGPAPTEGEELLAVGFGRTATEWVPNELHGGTFAVTGVGIDTLAVDGSDTSASLCKGDAGGPLLRVGPELPQLVALHGNSWQGGCLGETDTRRTATEVRVDGLAAWIAESTSNNYVALPRIGRLVDTRNGTGTTAGPLTASSTIDFQALGVAGVPATGVSSLLVDVTTVSPTANTYLTVFPEGSTRPKSSSLNAAAGETISTTQVVTVGPTGRLSLFNRYGSTHVVVDVHGYFGTSGGGGLVAVDHARVVDTRKGTGTPVGTIPNGGSRTFTLTGNGVIPTGATSVFLDVVVVGATGGGVLSAYPAGGTADLASVLDYVSGTTAQGVVVRLSADGAVTFLNRGPSVHLVISVQGYVTADPAAGADLRPAPAIQLVDTRENGGAPIEAKGSLFVQLTGDTGIPLNAMAGAILSITTASPTASGFLTVEADSLFPATEDGPVVTSQSVANFAAGHSPRTTMVMTRVFRDRGRPTDFGKPGRIRILNVSSGTVHVIVTLHGWFNPPPAAGT